MLQTIRPSEKMLSAIMDNDVDALREALDAGADPNFQRTRNTALTLALDRGHKDCAQILLERGANPSQDNGFGWTPMHEIAKQGWADWTQKLLANPMAMTDRRDRNEETPLFVAMQNGHIQVAHLLVDHGCNVNAQNEQGISPLMLAIERRDEELVQKMMARRGDPALKDETGRSGLDRAENWPQGQALLGGSGRSVEATPAAPIAEQASEQAEVQQPEENTSMASTGVPTIQKRRRPS